MLFNNKNKIQTTEEVLEWLKDNFGKKIPLSVGLNVDGTVRLLEIKKKLSPNDVEKIKKKYPELS
tara:strand:- start:82 stop:276 length:195 start_codon:yes stop_codon:yes gene_type:complete